MRETLRTLVDVRARRAGSTRLNILLLVFTLFFAAVFVDMVRLQTTDHKKYDALAERNSSRSIPLGPVRASIVDRNGEYLAVDTPKFRQVRILTNGRWEDTEIDFKRASAIAEKGVTKDSYIEAVPRRYYPAGESVSQITGYVGEISKKELRVMRPHGYKPGARIGKSGLEKEYEMRITGAWGRKLLHVDSHGRFLTSPGMKPPTGAGTLKTTIDMRIQNAAYQALRDRGKPGAVVFMNPHTGAVYAMATYPSFDNNTAVGGFDIETWRRLQNDPMHPLINRAMSIAVPLGSVFKMVVATAALEEGVIGEKDTVFCPGWFRLGRRTFKCWKKAGHGNIAIEDAIAHSCDVFFYTMGYKLGVTNIKKYAKILGLGHKTGIDLPGESIGLLPDPEWKKNFRGDIWYDGDTVNYSIGQGFIQVSPLQALVMANVFATHGSVVTPHIVESGYRLPKKLEISKKTIDLVRSGMRGAVVEGTSVRMLRFPYASAGKTGTAEDPPRTDHAWYVGFVPYEDPVFSFVVFVENGGHGSSDALPLALEVLRKTLDMGYFDDKQVSVKSADPEYN